MATTSLSSSLAIFAAPVLVSGSNKFGTIGALTRKDKKEKKRRNRTVSKITTTTTNDRDSSISTNFTSNSQWYTVSDADNMSMSSMNSNLSVFSSSSPVIELRQEVIKIIENLNLMFSTNFYDF